jgi:hypothetical protein
MLLCEKLLFNFKPFFNTKTCAKTNNAGRPVRQPDHQEIEPVNKEKA